MTEKRQTSQGYIVRILQHFATKLWNITNFVILFQAVMKFLSRLVEIKFLSITNPPSCWNSNRPYRLFTLHPMASFSCQIFTHVLCLVGLKITLFIEPKNSKKQIRPGKHGNIIFICP
jgi:hypothetical protein